MALANDIVEQMKAQWKPYEDKRKRICELYEHQCYKHIRGKCPLAIVGCYNITSIYRAPNNQRDILVRRIEEVYKNGYE